MKKKSNDLLDSFEAAREITRYQVARAVQIMRTMITQWHGENFWAFAPDNLLKFIEVSQLHGQQAKAKLIKLGFKFKKGTTDAI